MQNISPQNYLDKLNILSTEKINLISETIDLLPTLDKLTIINNEDHLIAPAIKRELPQIAMAIDIITTVLKQKGRLIYLGAGTSGRLGILDAVECPPTFGINPEIILGIIAGGYDAMFKSKEGAEDNYEDGKNALLSVNITNKDVLCAIAASGRTPFVIGALDYATLIGAKTIAVSCNKNALISSHADMNIEIDVGSEVISGSTRMKAGTAQKMVLNMISTVSMINIGKVYKNLMVDVQCTNKKLEERGKRIIMQICNVNMEVADIALKNANNNVKTACVMLVRKCNYEDALTLIDNENGFLRPIIL